MSNNSINATDPTGHTECRGVPPEQRAACEEQYDQGASYTTTVDQAPTPAAPFVPDGYSETGFNETLVLNWGTQNSDFTDGNGNYHNGTGYSYRYDCANFTAHGLKQSEPLMSDVNFLEGSILFQDIGQQFNYLQNAGYYTIEWTNPNGGQALYNNRDFILWLTGHRQEIGPGSLVVFSHEYGMIHGALVKGWELDPDRGIYLPRIMEHSAPDNGYSLPRFIDQSTGTDWEGVRRVRIVNPRWRINR